MRKNQKYLLLAAPILMALTVACSTRQFDDCPEGRRFGLWGVVNHTNEFGGSKDSLYYIINPIGFINDSLYFNANYTDSYYKADSTRITFSYGPGDSLMFYIDRMYAVQVNPETIIAKVRLKEDPDSIIRTTLKLTRTGKTEDLYLADRDSIFISLLKLEKPLFIKATNGPSTSNPEGSQNYTYILYPEGFNKALQMRDDLNPHPVEKSDSIKEKVSVKDKKEKDEKKSREERHKKGSKTKEGTKKTHNIKL